MSDSVSEPAIDSEREESRTLVYVVVAALLTALTALEVASSYILTNRLVLVPVISILSAAKFGLVVLFYMHLKYDSWSFSAIFFPLVLLAALVAAVLLMLMVTFFSAH